MKKSKFFINVRLQHEGFHRWPDAPDNLSYLRSRHRHVFFFDIELGVEHGDRDVEFIIVKELVSDWLTVVFNKEFNDLSCESIAVVTDEMLKKQGYRVRRIMVSEDNENGGGIVYE